MSDIYYDLYDDLKQKEQRMIFTDDKGRKGERKKNTLYLGIELEVDESNDLVEMCNEILDITDKITFHEDESLSYEGGVELVSDPCTLVWHYNLGWEDIISACKKYKAKSHNAECCGLHIHFNRDFLNDDEDLIKLIYLFGTFEKELRKFSRRTSMEYCRTIDLPPADYRHSTRKKSLLRLSKEDKNNMMWRTEKYHYHTIATNKRGTVEIRLWRGTLNPITFMASLEITDHLVRLVAETPKKYIKSLTWGQLCYELLLYRNSNNLAKYLLKRKLITEDIIPTRIDMLKRRIKKGVDKCLTTVL